MVQVAGKKMGLAVEVDHLQNPRVEAEDHYYNAKHSKLIDLGLKPHFLSDSLLDSLMNIAVKYRSRIDASWMLPQVDWRQPSNRRRRSLVDTPECVPRTSRKRAVVGAIRAKQGASPLASK
jgi:hypothetical protein